MRRVPEVALLLAAAWPATARAVVDPVPGSAPAPFVVAVGAQPLACGAAFGVQCTGVPLSRTRVLTSAHCLQLEQAIGSVDVLEPRRDGQPDRVIGVTRWWKHPRYDGAGAWDVAVLELEEALEGAPPALVTDGAPAMAVGDTLTVFGFGAASHAGDGVGVLRAGTLRVAEVGPGELRLEAAPSMSCKGDSGGPVGRVRDGRWEIVGLTTRGDPGCRRWGGALRLDALAELLGPVREQAPPPALPGPAAAYRSLCASTCASDGDCPAATRCLGEPGGAGQCVPAGLPPGELVGRGSCQAGCDACVQLWPGAACECYRFCRRAPTTPSGCTLARGPSSGAGALLVLALLFVRRWRAT